MVRKTAFESVLGVSPEPLEISFEEEMLQQEELLYELNQGNHLLSEVQRTEQIHEGLHDLQTVSLSVESATLQDLALIEIASNLATAGTRVSAEQLFPSLESALHTRISTESLADTAQQIWKRIMAALQRLMSVFARFWDSLFSTADRLKLANERLKARAKAAQGRILRQNTVELRTEQRKLEVNGKLAGNAATLSKHLVEARRQLKVVLNQYVGGVIDTGSKLALATNQTMLTPELYLQSMIQAAENLNFRSMAQLLNARPYMDYRFAAGEVVAAPALLGNRSLFINADGNMGREAASLLAQADRARHRRIQMAASGISDGKTSNEPVEIQAFTAQEVMQLSKEMDELLELVVTFKKSGKRNQLAKLNKALLDATDVAQRKVHANVTTESDSTHYRSASRFVTTYTTWTQNPHDAMCTHLLSVCRAVIAACNKSIALHR